MPATPSTQTKTPKPLTAISAAIGEKDIDTALWAAAKLWLYQINCLEAGSKDLNIAIGGLAKLLIDIKKSNPVTDVDKQALLDELAEYVNGLE